MEEAKLAARQLEDALPESAIPAEAKHHISLYRYTSTLSPISLQSIPKLMPAVERRVLGEPAKVLAVEEKGDTAEDTGRSEGEQDHDGIDKALGEGERDDPVSHSCGEPSEGIAA